MRPPASARRLEVTWRSPGPAQPLPAHPATAEQLLLRAPRQLSRSLPPRQPVPASWRASSRCLGQRPLQLADMGPSFAWPSVRALHLRGVRTLIRSNCCQTGGGQAAALRQRQRRFQRSWWQRPGPRVPVTLNLFWVCGRCRASDFGLASTRAGNLGECPQLRFASSCPHWQFHTHYVRQTRGISERSGGSNATPAGKQGEGRLTLHII